MGAKGVAGLAAALVGAAVLLSGCGTGGVATGRPDTATGETLFKQHCAACHTLAAAGATGTIGPSLDAAFAFDRSQGFPDSSIENVVLDQIRLGSGPIQNGVPGQETEEPTMPAHIVTGQDAVDVAGYVASVAGQNGPAPPSPATLGTDGKKIFQGECASCHTLKAAGATGTVGPNLDQLKPAKAIVERQVTNGGAIMPSFKGKLSAAQIGAVAAYVSSNAGK